MHVPFAGRSQKCPFGLLLEHHCKLPDCLGRRRAAAAPAAAPPGQADAAGAMLAAAGGFRWPLSGRADAVTMGCRPAADGNPSQGVSGFDPGNDAGLGSADDQGPRPRQRRRLMPNLAPLGGCAHPGPAEGAPWAAGSQHVGSQGASQASRALSQGRGQGVGGATPLSQLPSLAESPRLSAASPGAWSLPSNGRLLTQAPLLPTSCASGEGPCPGCRNPELGLVVCSPASIGLPPCSRAGGADPSQGLPNSDAPPGACRLPGNGQPLTQAPPLVSSGAGVSQVCCNLNPKQGSSSTAGLASQAGLSQIFCSADSRRTVAPAPPCAGPRMPPGGDAGEAAGVPVAKQAELIAACVPHLRVIDFVWAVIRRIVPAVRCPAASTRTSPHRRLCMKKRACSCVSLAH